MRIKIALAIVMSLALLAAGALLWRSREPEPLPDIPDPVWVTVLDEAGRERRVELETFVLGVVAGEMPATFAPAALQAQAVAARTYIARAMEQPRHGNAAVCCDSACCQAYLDDRQLRQQWGGSYEPYRRRLLAAVTATAGQALYYEGELALTVFCSACGGRTEAAAACWGRDVPYLQPVECGWCGHASRYRGGVSYSLEEAAVRLDAEPAELYALAVTELTPGGRAASISSGSHSWPGTEFRARLGLDSTACAWLVLGGELHCFTVGYGHGVGLCQYGADGLGRAGYGYEEILARYYPGCTIGEMLL